MPEISKDKSSGPDHTRRKKFSLARIWRKLGPGLITGSSDDDPSGIATYSQAGASFGLATLWTAWITFPLMASIQEICARIGLVTSRGLTGTLKDFYPKPVLYLMLLFSFPAIIMNIGANIAAMGAVGNMIVPGIDAGYFSVLFTVMLLGFIIYLPYRKFASILKYLCGALLVYMIVPFFINLDWAQVARASVVPDFRFDADFIAILVAILGTTISPYLFFWQATMEVEEMKHKERKVIVDKRIIGAMNRDVNFGMLFSNVIMFFIILTTGTVLYQAGIHDIQTVDQAAAALRPLAGDSAYLLFAIGIIGTGLLAIPVLSGSLSYMVCETFDLEIGLDKKFSEAKAFYSIITLSLLLGLTLNYVGITPVQGLIYSAILYGVTAPVLIAIILHIGNNKRVMGEFTNGWLSNTLGFLALLLMTAAALLLLYFEFL